MGELFQPTHLIILMMIFAIPLCAIHFVPTIIAGVRKTKNFWWIFAINFFLGWTIVGWIAALIWALRDDPKWVPAVS